MPEDRQADRRDRGEEDSQDRGAVQLEPGPANRSMNFISFGSMSKKQFGAVVSQVHSIDFDTPLLPTVV